MDIPLVVRLPTFLNFFNSNKNDPPSSVNADGHTSLYQYKFITDHINERSKSKTSKFQKASLTDLAWLDSVKMPSTIRDFYENFEPIEPIQLERVFLLPIKELKLRMTTTPMGKIIQPYGYVIVAVTRGDDVYCTDIHMTDRKGHSPIYLITGNALTNNNSLKNIKEACYLIATSFISFLDGL